jgi:hypothetical protein
LPLVFAPVAAIKVILGFVVMTAARADFCTAANNAKLRTQAACFVVRDHNGGSSAFACL